MVGTSGRRSGRAAAKRAAAALESTPKHFDHFDDDDDEDESMLDADDAPPEASSPAAEDSINPEADEDEQEDTGAKEEAAPEEDDKSEAEFKEPSPPVIMIRKKRLGRPPKNKPPDWEQFIEVPATEADLMNTPRRRGRGGWRGRGGRRGAPAVPTTQVIDKDGNTAPIANDELDLPKDPLGENKVDELGYLKDGREYRCRTFKVAGRGDRLYMLSTEPARCVGFRDSYLFFTKHRKLFKVLVDDEEKRDMIERDIIPHSYKGRSIGIVTARSVFREFGALIIVGGKRIVDDYEVAAARAEEVVEGEIADPNDHFVVGEPYNQNQYVAWFGASAVYHAGGQAAPVVNGKVDAKKRRVAVNDVNWMLEHSRDASTFNSSLSAARKHNINGIYDIHTNTVQYPAALQPTHARAIQIAPSEEEAVADENFPPVPTLVSRNFLVHDIHMETPPTGIAPTSYQKPYQEEVDLAADFLAPFRGLSAVSDEITDLLPPECRAAFLEAQGKEKEWHGRWKNEKDGMSRREPVIDKAVVAYAMALPKDHAY